MQATTAPLFAAVLTPHRSMGPKGIRIVAGLGLLLAMLTGLAVLSGGAWPVIALIALDLVAISIALKTSRQEGKRREEVSLWSDRLEVVAVTPKGAPTRTSFKPTAVRLVVERDFDEHTTALKLRNGDADTEIGSFLTADEKASFSKALGTALRRARAESVTSKPGRQP